MSLKSHWFQKYQPSKLNKRKTLLRQFWFLGPFLKNQCFGKMGMAGNLDFEAQGRDSTFTYLHALLK